MGEWLLVVFTKSNTPLWVFFAFFKLYKWHQIAQRITYICRYDHGILHNTKKQDSEDRGWEAGWLLWGEVWGDDFYQFLVKLKKTTIFITKSFSSFC